MATTSVILPICEPPGPPGGFPASGPDFRPTLRLVFFAKHEQFYLKALDHLVDNVDIYLLLFFIFQIIANEHLCLHS